MSSTLTRLAKLREFRDGMDVQDYLTGEMRQNLLAIEAALKTSSDSVTNIQSKKQVPRYICIATKGFGSASSSTYTPIASYLSAPYNEDGAFNISSGEFSVKTTGTYMVEVLLSQVHYSTSGSVSIGFFVNGTSVDTQQMNMGTSAYAPFPYSSTFSMQENDVFDVRVISSSGTWTYTDFFIKITLLSEE